MEVLGFVPNDDVTPLEVVREKTVMSKNTKSAYEK